MNQSFHSMTSPRANAEPNPERVFARRAPLAAAFAILLVFVALFGASASTAEAASTGIKLPFDASTGTWKVTSGYNNGDHHTGSNKYSVDLQRNSGTTAGTTILAPVSGTFDYTFDCFTGGAKAGIGVNIRVDGVRVGQNYLFVQVCHLATAPATGHVNRGAVLGTIYNSGAASSHVHIGLFSADFSSTNSTRVAVASDGDDALDGRSLPATTAANAYQCGGSYQPGCDVRSSQGGTSTANAALTSPAAGSTLPGSSATFGRNNGAGANAWFLGVGSSAGAGDIFWNWFPSNSITVSGIPADGRLIYVRLFSLINNQWQSTDYTFRAASTVVSRSEVVVDETSGQFSKGGSYWQNSTIGYGGHAFWTYVNGNVTDSWGEWQATLAGGNYEVYVYVPRNNGTTQQARYDIYNSAGTASRIVNQNSYYDAWISVGTYSFSAGTTRRVRLTDATGEAASSLRKVAFDAVKFVPR